MIMKYNKCGKSKYDVLWRYVVRVFNFYWVVVEVINFDY